MSVLSLKRRLVLASLFASSFAVGGCVDGGSSPTMCTNTCRFAGDGECDDGGGGSTTGLCAFGSDCDDCGSRGGPAPMGPAPMEEGECPEGCATNEVCVRLHGCLPLCDASDDCASGCCAPLEGGRNACADPSYCDDPMPPDPPTPPDPMEGTPATLSPTTPTTSIPNESICSGDEASASGDLDAVNTPLFAGDTHVSRFSARYELSSFFGEPTRAVAFAWEGTGLLGDVTWVAEVQTQDGNFQYVTDAGQRVYASWEGGTIGDPGEGFGFDTTGSPSWDETFVTYDGSQFQLTVSEDEAKRIYRGCFRLGGLRLLEINGDPALHP